jgi:glyoxylase-like metal-dependent hydrolase (beta-lactamase superfamily II)/rhodanese-related sulfurtransferase
MTDQFQTQYPVVPDIPEDEVKHLAISCEQFYERIVNRQPMQVLDVREPAGRGPFTFSNDCPPCSRCLEIPYFDVEQSLAEISSEKEVIAVCARGRKARYIAQKLGKLGYEAHYLKGGLEGWANFYDHVDVVDEPYGRITQIVRPGRGNLSYVVMSDGEAAIIDPTRHTKEFIDEVFFLGAKTKFIFETHLQADYISGGPLLSRLMNAPYYLHPYDAIHPVEMVPVRFSYQPLYDRQSFKLGQWEIKIIWFPGHTLGQVNLLFTAPTNETFLFTGDGLFLESFGRPDLGGKADNWAPLLYESLTERIKPLVKEDTLILPSHFSSFIESPGQGLFTNTYRQICDHNPMIKPGSKRKFLDYVLNNLPDFPPEYLEMKSINAGLLEVDETRAMELEAGKNLCAI